MAGRADAEQVEPRLATDRGVDDRQRDGDAQPAFEHVAEIAVPRVVIIVVVAAKTFSLIEQLADRVQTLSDVLPPETVTASRADCPRRSNSASGC